MGLDIALGLIILAAAVRGWLRGFVLQAIRLGGLVGSLYAAAPIRDVTRPYVAEYLPSLSDSLLDRLLWWTSAIVTYFVSVGLAGLAVKMYRKQPFGETEPNRSDQFAGFFVGALKGGLVASFIVAGLHKYVADRVKGIDWAEEQRTTSYALKLHEKYDPAKTIWTSQPVQQVVSHVRKMGFPAGATGEPPAAKPADEPRQAASIEGPPRLELDLSHVPGIDPSGLRFKAEFDRIYQELMPKTQP